MNDPAQRIRDRARQIWLEEGQPAGMDEVYRERARLEIESSDRNAGRQATTSQQRRLDDALEETFPSSDPPSESQPGGGITGPG